jgi:RNA polymerase sigma-70 factor (ECF subfamily)
MVGHEADARDCYQKVFLEAFQYSRKHPKKEAVNDWEKLLKRIARTCAIDLLRQRYRTAARVDATADLETSLSRFSAPENEAEAAELAEQLRICLARLPQQQAEVFVMRFVEQLSYDEIAERTGSNRNAVGAMLNRARRQLRKHFDEDSSTTVKSRRVRHDQ